MIQNDNGKFIKKLGKRSLTSNKLRNLFIILAIVLTTMLLTVAFTMGASINEGYKAYNILNYSGMTLDGTMEVTKQQYDTLKKSDKVSKVQYIRQLPLVNINNKELSKENVTIQGADDVEVFNTLGINLIKGDFPKKDKEIIAPNWLLDVLNVKKQVGEKLTLDMDINGVNTSVEFKLSGYYESIVRRNVSLGSLFVSESYIEKLNNRNLNIGVAVVKLKSLNEKSTLEEAKNELKNLAKDNKIETFKESDKFTKEFKMNNRSNDMIIPMVVAVLIILISSYLVIYNIFYISVVKDIRFYGLLKTLGATNKQIKKIMITQGVFLSIIGIPLGLILGYLLGIKFVPLIGKMFVFKALLKVNFNIYIFIFSALFSLITVYISCNKSVKIAKRISLVEAVKYASVGTSTFKKKTIKGYNGAKVNKMAWRNLIKNKKRVFVSILSVTLSGIIFIFTVNAFMGMNPEKHADSQVFWDCEIENKFHMALEDSYTPISKDLCDKISNLDFVEKEVLYYNGVTRSKDGKIKSLRGELLPEKRLLEQFKAFGDPNRMYCGYDITENGNITADIRGLNAKEIKNETSVAEVIDGKIDEKEFAKGNYIILYQYKDLKKKQVVKPGEKIPISFVIRDEKGNENLVKEDFTVMALVQSKEERPNNLTTLNIEESKLKTIYKDYDKYISSIGIKYKEDIDLKKADDKIKEIIASTGIESLDMSSKYYFIDGIKTLKKTLTLAGLTISIILGVIGIINVINTVLTGVLTRKIEFSMLESIGMTKKQIKKMIVFEGVYYGVLSTALLIPLGFVVAVITSKVALTYDVVNLKVYIVSELICIGVNLFFMIVTPLCGYKYISKNSIVERLREIE